MGVRFIELNSHRHVVHGWAGPREGIKDANDSIPSRLKVADFAAHIVAALCDIFEATQVPDKAAVLTFGCKRSARFAKITTVP